jgi:hypothetical protein
MSNEITIVLEEFVGRSCSACKVIGAWSNWDKANIEANKLRKEMREKGIEAIYETVTLVVDEGGR